MNMNGVTLPLKVVDVRLEDDCVHMRVEDYEGKEISRIEVIPEESKVTIGDYTLRASMCDWFVESGTATLAAGKIR